MNILPHKSWHVRTKKNIEKVQRDEAKAADEEKEKQRKIALAEQESRTELLRARARAKNVEVCPASQSITSDKGDGETQSGALEVFTSGPGGDTVEVQGLGSTSEHMNFFKDLEDGLTKQGKNKEHEEEKKKEQEQLEKKIGLLTYLGQTALDEKETGPWYMNKSHRKKRKKDESDSEEEEDKEKKLKLALEAKRRQSLDPLLEMKEYLHKKKHKKHKHKSKEKSKDNRRPSNSSKSTVPSSSSTSFSSSTSSKKTIEQLRAERVGRERGEKLRTEALLRKSKEVGSGEGKSKKEDSSSDSEDENSRQSGPSGKRRYNSQYNPEFVQQHRTKRKEKFY